MDTHSVDTDIASTAKKWKDGPRSKSHAANLTWVASVPRAKGKNHLFGEKRPGVGVPKVSGQASLLDGELQLCSDLMSTGIMEGCFGSIRGEGTGVATELEGHPMQGLVMSVGATTEGGCP